MTRPLTPDLCIFGAGSRVCRSPQTLAQMGAAVVLIERGLIMGKSEPFPRFTPAGNFALCRWVEQEPAVACLRSRSHNDDRVKAGATTVAVQRENEHQRIAVVFTPPLIRERVQPGWRIEDSHPGGTGDRREKPLHAPAVGGRSRSPD